MTLQKWGDRNMIKSIYTSTLILLICACGQTNSKSDKKENSEQTIKTIDKTQTSEVTVNLNILDSIEKENNESVVASEANINKPFVFLKDGDSTIHLTSNKWQDHRIFGYAQPDVKSERLLLLSVFTNDVENNPFGFRLGAYYDTRSMDELTLKYNSTIANFVKATAIDKANNSTTVYFEKKWIAFE